MWAECRPVLSMANELQEERESTRWESAWRATLLDLPASAFAVKVPGPVITPEGLLGTRRIG